MPLEPHARGSVCVVCRMALLEAGSPSAFGPVCSDCAAMARHPQLPSSIQRRAALDAALSARPDPPAASQTPGSNPLESDASGKALEAVGGRLGCAMEVVGILSVPAGIIGMIGLGSLEPEGFQVAAFMAAVVIIGCAVMLCLIGTWAAHLSTFLRELARDLTRPRP